MNIINQISPPEPRAARAADTPNTAALDTFHDDAVAKCVTASGLTIIVDKDDESLLRKYTWCARTCRPKPYPYAWDKGARGHVHLHRLIVGAKPGEFVDHINGNVLDNRKTNLRICDRQQNARNRRVTRGKNPKSPRYKGVFSTANPAKFRACIFAGGKQKFLGVFVSAEEAARAYDAAARELHGEFCCVNFPNEGESSAFHNEAEHA